MNDTEGKTMSAWRRLIGAEVPLMPKTNHVKLKIKNIQEDLEYASHQYNA